MWLGPSRGAGRAASGTLTPASTAAAAGAGLVGFLDTWAAAWGPPGTRTCPWGAQVSCPWECHGPGLSKQGCETSGCGAHPAAGAAGETPAPSSGSLWLLACPSRDGRWCPLLLLGTCCVTRFGCTGNEAGCFGQGGGEDDSGGWFIPMLLAFQEPPCHAHPAATAAQGHPKHCKACRAHGVLPAPEARFLYLCAQMS